MVRSVLRGLCALCLVLLPAAGMAQSPAPVLFAMSGQPIAFTIRLERKRFLADETWYVDGSCMGKVVRGPVVSVQLNSTIADFSVYIAPKALGATRVICLADAEIIPTPLRRALDALQ